MLKVSNCRPQCHEHALLSVLTCCQAGQPGTLQILQQAVLEGAKVHYHARTAVKALLGELDDAYLHSLCKHRMHKQLAGAVVLVQDRLGVPLQLMLGVELQSRVHTTSCTAVVLECCSKPDV